MDILLYIVHALENFSITPPWEKTNSTTGIVSVWISACTWYTFSSYLYIQCNKMLNEVSSVWCVPTVSSQPAIHSRLQCHRSQWNYSEFHKWLGPGLYLNFLNCQIPIIIDVQFMGAHEDIHHLNSKTKKKWNTNQAHYKQKAVIVEMQLSLNENCSLQTSV